jgi:hypothetical protein
VGLFFVKTSFIVRLNLFFIKASLLSDELIIDISLFFISLFGEQKVKQKAQPLSKGN